MLSVSGEDPPLVVQLIIIFLFSFGLMFMGYVFLLQHKLWNCINAFPVSVRYAFFLSYLSFFGFIVYGIVPAAILQLITASLGYTVKQAHFCELRPFIRFSLDANTYSLLCNSH